MGGYPKGRQQKGAKDLVKCEHCGKPGHLKTNCWSFNGKGGGKTVNEFEGVDGFWEISAFNRVSSQSRYSAFADSDTESDTEDEANPISTEVNNESWLTA